jgi:glycosyltransferase involved in cell wall biosynthesis
MTAGPASTVLRQDHRPKSAAEKSPGRRSERPIERIALIGNFLPRLCGIATFTTHLHAALRASPERSPIDVYAMVESGQNYAFPPEVTMAIDQDKRDSYIRAARRIELSGADVVWVQHEFGIYGGPAGEMLFDLLDNVSAPVAVTLHTVLQYPSPEQRRVAERLARRATILIVMAHRARDLLHTVYGIPRAKCAVIEHGVPERAYETPALARRRFGVEDRPTIMTFGLLSPDKGIATMIRAMPAILRRCPDAIYRIVGATHPHLLAHGGERHREDLQRLAQELGIDRSLIWENRFLDESALLDRLATADVYVTPYRNPQQITSGTLAYAAALGKPIVATPYVHAIELLAEGRGQLVDFDSPDQLATAVAGLLTDAGQAQRVSSRVYAHSRDLTWARSVERALLLLTEEGFQPGVPVRRDSAQSRASLRNAPADIKLARIAERTFPGGRCIEPCSDDRGSMRLPSTDRQEQGHDNDVRMASN